MKKTMKIMSIMLVFAMLFMTTVAMAKEGPFDKIEGQNGEQLVGNSMVQTIIGVITMLGYVIAVGMIIYIGIKYVMASANEKADLKSSLVKYLIGAVLIAGGATLASWIFNALASGNA